MCNEAESTWENMTCSSQLPTFDLTLLFNTREPVNKPVLYRPVWLSLPLAKLQSDNTCCIIYHGHDFSFPKLQGGVALSLVPRLFLHKYQNLESVCLGKSARQANNNTLFAFFRCASRKWQSHFLYKYADLV